MNHLESLRVLVAALAVTVPGGVAAYAQAGPDPGPMPAPSNVTVSISSITNAPGWPLVYLQQDGENSMTGLCAWGANGNPGPTYASGTITYAIQNNGADGTSALAAADVVFDGYNNGDGCEAYTTFLGDPANLGAAGTTAGFFTIPSSPFSGSGPQMNSAIYYFNGSSYCSANP